MKSVQILMREATNDLMGSVGVRGNIEALEARKYFARFDGPHDTEDQGVISIDRIPIVDIDMLNHGPIPVKAAPIDGHQ